ncbi:MAG: SLC13 family permease [Methanolinea sp.]|nr:SLC13 family permease [Methanolinea sp.]
MTQGTFLPPVPIIVLLAVFVLIAVRQVGRFRFRIWQVMCMGALAVLFIGEISPRDALFSINPDVMLFLLGMFIVGEALEESGYLRVLAFRLFSRARSRREFILFILVFMGLLSALLMNDTVAIIATPVVIAYACRFGLPPGKALLALCFAVTTGSVPSPIGNPQNLLVATYSQLSQPFLTFLVYLGLPTAISLVVTYLLLTYDLDQEECECSFDEGQDGVRDEKLTQISRISLALILLLIVVRVVTGPSLIPLSVIAIAGAAPVIILSRDRAGIVKSIDWPTLAFFAAMFVLMQSVYNTGIFQSGIDFRSLTSIPLILSTSACISQFISNVPFVALFLPLIMKEGMPVASLMALAAGSTIAGNLTILGAASNVIIIENAEKKGYTITFFEFIRIGLPLTLAQIIIYAVFLAIM